VWTVIAINAAWVLFEWRIGGREALGIIDNVIPSLLCIPMIVEFSLRLIYEPGHTGTVWSPAERDRKAGSVLGQTWHRIQNCLCIPCQTLCPCCVTQCCDSVETAFELALCRSPLVALDSVAICSYIVDHWVLLSAVAVSPATALLRGYVHAFSSATQLLRLLRPWAVGTREQNWPLACTGGPAGHAFAVWLTTDSSQLMGAGGEEGPDLERQHMISKAERTRAPGAFSGSALLNGW